eukprot:scaffold4145_cov55-Attheya_sp.AAC.9
MDRDNERYSIMSYRLEGTSTQLIQSCLPGIGNAGFRQYGMPDSYMSDNYLFCKIVVLQGSRLTTIISLPTACAV